MKLAYTYIYIIPNLIINIYIYVNIILYIYVYCVNYID